MFFSQSVIITWVRYKLMLWNQIIMESSCSVYFRWTLNLHFSQALLHFRLLAFTRDQITHNAARLCDFKCKMREMIEQIHLIRVAAAANSLQQMRDIYHR